MHDRISANALCFPAADLAQMEAVWRALAPRRVSVTAGLLEGAALDARRVLDKGGYRLETISTSFASGRGLERGDDERTESDRQRLSRLIADAQMLQARSIYMTTGSHGPGSWEDAAACFSDMIAPCLAEAKAAGVPLLLETTTPLHADIHLAHSLRDTVDLAEQADMGICIDIFACWGEAGLKQTIERAMTRCRLVQVSDYVLGDRALPARAVPGDGHIPLRLILDWILSAGYEGGFELELIGPRIDAEGQLEATRRAGDYLGELLHSLGADSA